MKRLLSFYLVGFISFALPLSSIEISLQLPFQESFANSNIKVKALNDSGQLLGSYVKPKCTTQFFILDVEKGVQLISQKNQSVNPYKINNVGQVLVDGFSIWSEDSGFTKLEQPEGINVQGLEINDAGQIIGTFRQKGFADYRPFKWEKGEIIDLGPGSDFAKGFEELGLYPIRIEVKDINNNGYLVGKVHYGKFNALTGKYVKVGCSNFFWDGSVHLIELTKGGYFDTIKLNEQGDVLLCSPPSTYKSFIWKLKSELVTIDGIRATDFNDNRVIIGYMQVEQKDGQLLEVPGIAANGTLYSIAQLLGVEDVKRLHDPYSDHYEAESLLRMVAINNVNQIAAECTVWGDIYPCILLLDGIGK